MDPACQLGEGIALAIRIYTLIMLVYAVVSWIPDIRGRWSDYIALMVDPILNPVRRLIPPVGGFDLSFLIVLILLQFLAGFIVRATCSIYY